MKHMLKTIRSFIVDYGSAGSYGGISVISIVLANIFGFIYNAFLVRSLQLEDFALISLFSSLLTIVSILSGALTRTVTHRVAFINGKFATQGNVFWKKTRQDVTKISLVIGLVTLISAPVLAVLFHETRLIPFVLFVPVIPFVLIASVDSGYLNGIHLFGLSAVLTLIEAISKFLFSLLFVILGKSEYVFLSLPCSLLVALIIGYIGVRKVQKKDTAMVESAEYIRFPKKFFLGGIGSKITSLAFLSVDVIVVKAFFPPIVAGQYAILSLAGKMVFLTTSLGSTLLNPVISKTLGQGKTGSKQFSSMFLQSIAVGFIGFLLFGIIGFLTTPILFGSKAVPIIQYLPWYCLAIYLYTISDVIVNYHHVQNRYVFPFIGFLTSLILITIVSFFHRTIWSVVDAITFVSIFYFISIVIFHCNYEKILSIIRNIKDGVSIFDTYQKDQLQTNSLRILILNWRDTKHVWSGGSEVYIHEVAKRLVREGHNVTVFCGNDTKSLRNEIVDGVEVVRRGGFYTVYIWAALYYLLKFRGNFDVVLDSENGIPFFSPLYAGVPVFLLIHHVHQEVFRKYLPFHLRVVALILESKIMPFIYRNVPIVSVSPSTSEALRKLHLHPICEITPGIDGKLYSLGVKTTHPSILYLGRLKSYKRIELAILAFAQLIKKYPKARFTIAGFGEHEIELKKLVHELHLRDVVTFLGKVSEEVKMKLLGESWLMVQPSFIEGWGMTVIEASAMGTPVVAADSSGLRDSVIHNKTGYLLKNPSPVSFYSTMKKIIDNTSLREELGSNGRQWAQAHDWDNSSSMLLALIVKTLRERDTYHPSTRSFIRLVRRIT